MPRKKKVELPAEGDAFAFKLDDGRYSVCRVIHGKNSDAARDWKSKCVLVACSAWIGTEVPDAENPVLRPILCLTHHSWPGKQELLWVSEPVPNDFILIGSIQPTPEEKQIACGTFGVWGSMSIQPLMQWRWDNDRDAVLAEDKVKKAKENEDRKRAQAERRAYLSSVTLEDLVKHRFFANWTYPPAKATRESRKIMASTVRGLVELGLSATEDRRMAVLRSCIESFNELDAKLEFIETEEREDICEEFEAVVHACGLGPHDNLADEWRQW